jgi:T-complex protein 1 subunit theta
MLKCGSSHLQGLEEAVLKNLEACKALGINFRTSMGPNGMNKLVVSHEGKIFTTSDTETMLNNLEIAHPAAKLIAIAANAQQHEIGDGANLVVILAGELLSSAESLIRDGLHPSEIVNGYRKAAHWALKELDSLILPESDKFENLNENDVMQRLKASVASKQYGYEDLLCRLIAKACIDSCPNNPKNFNVDNVRVVKFLGGGIDESVVIKGLILTGDTLGTVRHVRNAKIVVYAHGINTPSTETKCSVLLHSASELENFNKSEETLTENFVKKIVDLGIKAILVGSSLDEITQCFLEKYGIMIIRIHSKFELQRICLVTGCCSLARLDLPSKKELGFAKSIKVREIGSKKCIFLEQETIMNQFTTIILRGATHQILDEIERAVAVGVNSYKALCKDARTLPAGGATEMAIAKRLSDIARLETGIEQHAIQKFAEAFEVVPRTLANNSGLCSVDIISAMWSEHMLGKKEIGVDLESGTLKELSKEGIVDLYIVKWWALRLLFDAVTTVLKIDHIIMAKHAGRSNSDVKTGETA